MERTSPTQVGQDGTNPADYEVIIIGAGITGLYQLHVIRQAGISVRLLEAGGGIGGTWFWNRYPGCRLDSECYTYQYVFDEELLAETEWKEIFATQPDVETYVNHFADRFNLREDIQLNTRVESMTFDEDDRAWSLTADDGRLFRARFVITATGILSAPLFPPFPGIDRFKGELYHTGLWPAKKVEFKGKRVAVVGTGASGVQIIPLVAEEADHLTVFQRTPNWAVPLRNAPLTADDRARIREGFPEMLAKLQKTTFGFVHDFDETPFFEVSESDRIAKFEELYNTPGLAKWLATYRDVMTNTEANAIYSEFIASKIRERITDPAVADMLIPKDHPFGTKRVPCETNYYETYNRENVTLVPLANNPILEYTETGFLTAEGPLDFDMIILATGFDAFTGALNRIDIKGSDGTTLRDKWKDGPKTYMGLQVAGFPNLLINGGPHGKAGIGNSPRAAEPAIIWLAELVKYMRDHGLTRIEADPMAEIEWTESVNELASHSLAASVRSYSYGDNVPGKPRAYVAYPGTLPDFVERLEKTAAEGYPGFILS